MTAPTPLTSLLSDILSDRDTGTEDAWWRDRVGIALRDGYGDDCDQDEADRRRINRLPAVERALIEAEGQLALARELIALMEDQQARADGIESDRDRLRAATHEASDPDFILGTLDNVHDMDVTLPDYAAAVSRAIRAAMADRRPRLPDLSRDGRGPPRPVYPGARALHDDRVQVRKNGGFER